MVEHNETFVYLMFACFLSVTIVKSWKKLVYNFYNETRGCPRGTLKLKAALIILLMELTEKKASPSKFKSQGIRNGIVCR